jgi:hypothetical protein
MQNIFLIIKKYRIPIALVSVTLIVVAVALSLPKNTALPAQTPTPTPAPTAPPVPQSDWGKLDSIVSKLGTPVNKSDSSDKEGQYEYKSSSATRNNEVIYQSNVPLFYKEVVTKADNKTAQSIKGKYGNAEIRLYGPESNIGFHMYVYPAKGIAYIGSMYDDTITEVWYFAPTNLETFMNTWAKDYSITPQEGIF